VSAPNADHTQGNITYVNFRDGWVDTTAPECLLEWRTFELSRITCVVREDLEDNAVSYAEPQGLKPGLFLVITIRLSTNYVFKVTCLRTANG
jgi:hypothetical protein